MALLKMSALVTGIKGKVGGTIFQGSVSGQVMKNRQARQAFQPVLPSFDSSNPTQNQMRTAVPAVARAWRTLDDGQRAAWNAAAPSWPFINKYGEPYTGSGYQLFCQINLNLWTLGQTLQEDPPTAGVFEDTPDYTIAPYNVGGTNLAFGSAVPAGYIFTLSVSTDTRQSVNPVNKSYRIILQIPGPEAGPVDINAMIPAWLMNFRNASASVILNTTGKITKADAARASAPRTYAWDSNFP